MRMYYVRSVGLLMDLVVACSCLALHDQPRLGVDDIQEVHVHPNHVVV